MSLNHAFTKASALLSKGLLIGLLLNACQGQDELPLPEKSASDPSGGQAAVGDPLPKLSRIILSQGGVLNFAYEGDKVSQVREHWTSGVTEESTYQVTTTTTYDFLYQADQLQTTHIFTENIIKDGEQVEEFSFSRSVLYRYEDGGQQIHIQHTAEEYPLNIVQVVDENGLLQKKAFEQYGNSLGEAGYGWKGNNLYTERVINHDPFSGTESISTSEFTGYDSQPNPLGILNYIYSGSASRYLSANNPTGMKLTYSSGENTSTYEVFFEYEYNAKGYPVKLMERFPSGTRQLLMSIEYAE